MRFHGRRAETWEAKNITPAERFRYLYDREELADWAPRLRDAAKQTRDLHVLMNNCYANYGSTNARELATAPGRPQARATRRAAFSLVVEPGRSTSAACGGSAMPQRAASGVGGLRLGAHDERDRDDDHRRADEHRQVDLLVEQQRAEDDRHDRVDVCVGRDTRDTGACWSNHV